MSEGFAERCKKRWECPACGKITGVRILYGYPSHEAVAAYGRGDVELGGCMPDETLNRSCKSCGHRWLEGEPE
jgi:hypothetical protein